MFFFLFALDGITLLLSQRQKKSIVFHKRKIFFFFLISFGQHCIIIIPEIKKGLSLELNNKPIDGYPPPPPRFGVLLLTDIMTTKNKQTGKSAWTYFYKSPLKS